MQSNDASPVLELKGVSKSFGAVIALRTADLALYANSIHAVVGENGAGKSTLVKIMAGLYQRDNGTFTLDGTAVDFRSTAEAKAAGIAVIYQEPTLFPDLSVTENVFMGRQPTGRFGRIDKAAMRAEVVHLMERLGVRIDPDRPAEGLSIADQQIIEIAKAISLDARVLIMDEPTAALGVAEQKKVLNLVRTLKDQGIGIIIISHQMYDVFEVADRLAVMRRGLLVGERVVKDTTPDEVVGLIVGSETVGKER